MKCKNCGTKIKGNETVCPNCGAYVDEQSGYTVVTEDRRYEDVYSYEQKKPRTGWRFFLIALLVIAIAAGGAFVYFKYLQPVQMAAPELTFTTGYGTINEGQKVIFIQPQGGKDMEYIHGVSLYGGKAEGEPLTTDYEYTKNVDGTFRTVFFYVDDMKLDESATYSYTFVMTTSFTGSTARFDYTQTVDFPGKIEEDVSSTVFDHSMYERSEDENTAEATTEAATEEATTEAATAKKVSLDFAYEGYWYGAPAENGGKRAVDAFQFKSDGSYVITHYTQSGDSDWQTSTERGKFTAEGGTISLTAESGDKVEIKADDTAKTLTLNDGTQMAARKYNSKINASDLFEPEG